VALPAEGDRAQGCASVLDHTYLDANCGKDDTDEEEVVEESSEYVVLELADLAGVDLVEDLHEDERVEDQSEVSQLIIVVIEGGSFGILNAEYFLACEQQNKEHNDLVEGLAGNVAEHNRSDDGVTSWVGLVFKELVAGRLSGKGEGTAGVHDQVDPKHLDRGKGRVSQYDATNEHDEHGDYVNCELELEELADIGVDVSAPLDGGHD